MVCGSSPGKGKRFLFSPKHSDWLWGLSSLRFKGTRVLSQAKRGQAVKVTVHHTTVPMLRINGITDLLSLYGQGQLTYLLHGAESFLRS
jgi:hypothetical protein